MGLCKCPKKKVTNLFCFQHRVNVCEHCLVANHSQCIVQSYLRWLQDSDYNPVCMLCNQNLHMDGMDCVRLLCYDVFHWDCINAYAQKLPKNTAPAGYQCPICKMGLFPSANQVSPVAESLKTFLSQVNWARSGLGLPLLIEEQKETVEDTTFTGVSNHIGHPPIEHNDAKENSFTTNMNSFHQMNDTTQTAGALNASDYTTSSTNVTDHHQTSVAVNIEDTTSSLSNVLGSGHTDIYASSSASRKLFDTTGDDAFRNSSYDHDVDKYKRRPAFHWFAQWFKSRQGNRGRQAPTSTFKKFLVVLTIGLIGFITIVVLFSKFGREQADHDPFLDPMANPNIRVGNT